MAPITGTAQSVIAHIGSRATRPGSVTNRVAGVVGVGGFGAEVEPGHERAVAGGGEDRDPDVAVVARDR